VGFGLGDVTLTDFLVTHDLLPNLETPTTDLLITFQDDEGLIPAQQIAAALREKGADVCTTFSKLKFKKVFPLAEKKGANFVALLGSNEIENRTIQLKNMKTKEQFDINFDDTAKIIELIK
jgi:histidyl-tRNA synthetase